MSEDVLTERRDTTAKGRAVRQLIGEAIQEGSLLRTKGTFGLMRARCCNIASLLARAFALGEAHGIEVTTAETRALLPKEGS